MITTFGKFLDPIADKLLVVASLLILVEFDMIQIFSAFFDINEFVILLQSLKLIKSFGDKYGIILL